MTLPTGQSISLTGAALASGTGGDIRLAQRPSALLISKSERDQAALRAIFRAHSNWRLHVVCSCQEALSILLHDPIPVVICEASSEWESLLEILDALPARPKLIIASGDANEALWAAISGTGVYDVVPIPWNARQVFRVVCLAWRSWNFASRTGHRSRGSNETVSIRSRTAAAGGVFGD